MGDSNASDSQQRAEQSLGVKRKEGMPIVDCGASALQLLGKLHVLDLNALTWWLARRQMSFEEVFSGRSKKLVDGCYSFWQGGAMAITSAQCPVPSAMYNNATTTTTTMSNDTRDNDPWLDHYTTRCNNKRRIIIIIRRIWW